MGEKYKKVEKPLKMGKEMVEIGLEKKENGTIFNSFNEDLKADLLKAIGEELLCAGRIALEDEIFIFSYFLQLNGVDVERELMLDLVTYFCEFPEALANVKGGRRILSVTNTLLENWGNIMEKGIEKGYFWEKVRSEEK